MSTPIDLDALEKLAKEAGIEFQVHYGLGGRRNISTCGSIPIAKMQKFAELVVRASLPTLQPKLSEGGQDLPA